MNSKRGYWQERASMSGQQRMAMLNAVLRQMMRVSIGILFLIVLVHFQGYVAGNAEQMVPNHFPLN